jgi:transposase-like protein
MINGVYGLVQYCMIDRKISGRYSRGRENDGVYPKEFKAEAVAPAEKHEKPVHQITLDLGINANMLY